MRKVLFAYVRVLFPSGWSNKALILINELSTHNICDKIVVLSEMDKEILEQTVIEFYEDMMVRFPCSSRFFT
jgi:hypothetical protein